MNIKWDWMLKSTTIMHVTMKSDNCEYSLTYSVLEHNMCFLTSWSTSISFIFFPLGMTNLPCNIHCHYYIYCRAIMCNTPCYRCLLILLGFRMEAYQVVMAVAKRHEFSRGFSRFWKDWTWKSSVLFFPHSVLLHLLLTHAENVAAILFCTLHTRIYMSM
jgi:hypothetical protein